MSKLQRAYVWYCIAIIAGVILLELHSSFGGSYGGF